MGKKRLMRQLEFAIETSRATLETRRQVGRALTRARTWVLDYIAPLVWLVG